MKFFRKIVEKIRSPFSRLGQTPEYDWHFALWGFVIGLFLILITNVLIFMRLTSVADESDTDVNTPAVRLTKDTIDKAIKNIEQRDTNASAIPMVILDDPSL